MSLLDFFSFGLKKPSISPVIVELFGFLRDQINREDLIDPIWKEYKSTASLEGKEQTKALLVAYNKLETFIVSNRPLIVKESYTIETLRARIASMISSKDLPLGFQLYFAPRGLQQYIFFTIIIQAFITNIFKGYGGKHAHDLVSAIIRGTPLEGKVTIDEKFSFSPDVVSIPWDQVEGICRHIFTKVFEEVQRSFGERAAEDVLQSIFLDLEDVYAAHWLKEYLTYVPEGHLVTQRLGSLSRDELQTEVTQATQEEKHRAQEAQNLASQLAQKLVEIESQNKLLEDSKRAMMNILEDAKELEVKLARERDTAAAIVTSMNEGLIVVDKDYVIRSINPTAVGLLGVREIDVVGRPMDETIILYKGNVRIPKEDRHTYKTLHDGISSVTEAEEGYALASPVKRIPIAQSSAPLYENGVIVGALITFHDVTHELHEKELIEAKVRERTRELAEEKAKLLSSIESIGRAFIMVDVRGSVVLVNRILGDYFGQPQGAWSLGAVQQKFGSQIDLLALFTQAVTQKKKTTISELTFGSQFFSLLIAPVFLNESDLIGALVLITDITEERVLARSRDEFFSIASHELRTPLTAIRGNTSMILQYYADKLSDPELREMVSDVHESSIHLIDIVNDFLNVSRLEQRRLDFKLSAFDMSELCHKVLKEYEVTGSRQNIALSFDEPRSALPLVYADKDRVREVLINLVGNGLKFTEAGEVRIQCTVRESMMDISVTDTGRGIPVANQSLLFHKFQQAGDSLFTRDTTKGTGLGLYISKLMIEGMNGSIWLARSEVGKGSTFTFSLPLAADTV